MSNCLSVQDIDDTKDYRDTIVSLLNIIWSLSSYCDDQNAMNVIGLTEDEQNEIFKMLAIVLWLGNVQFQDGDDGNSDVIDTGVTDFVAYLMEVDAAKCRRL
jgi:myosin-1